MKKLFLSASAIFAVIPGIAIISGALSSPPDNTILFAGVIEAFGALSLLILWLNKNNIKRKTIKKITHLAIILGVVSFLSLAIYLWLYSFCVVKVDEKSEEGKMETKTVYFPIYTSGGLAELINLTEGGRPAVVAKYGSRRITARIQEMPGNPLAITTVLLLFVYQAVFTLLCLAFGILGIRLNGGFIVKEPENQPAT